MMKSVCANCAVLILVFSGCAVTSGLDEQPQVRDVQIRGQDLITPIELYATVGDEIRWHNLLSTPIHFGFLGVKTMQDVGCEKGFKTWFGGIKDVVKIPPGEYISVCFRRVGTVWYNIWTDLTDPVHSMSLTAVIHLIDAA